MSKKDKQQLELLKQQKQQLESLSKQTSMETIRAIEDRVLEDSIKIVEHVLNFAELGFDDNGNPVTPESWEFLSLEEKEKRIRLAKAGWMPSADIPHGVKLAHATMMGIIKARAQVESGDKTLNIESIIFPTPRSEPKQLEVIEIDNDS